MMKLWLLCLSGCRWFGLWWWWRSSYRGNGGKNGGETGTCTEPTKTTLSHYIPGTVAIPCIEILLKFIN